MATPQAPSGKSDIFLHLQAKRAGKIRGESKVTNHVDDIQVDSWMWGVSAASAVNSTQAQARRQYTALTVFKRIDVASTMLMSALATNDEIKEVKLTMRKSGGDPLPYYVIKLGGARIEQVTQEVFSDGQVRERLDIVFTTVEVEYKQQDAAGIVCNNVMFADELYPSA